MDFAERARIEHVVEFEIAEVDAEKTRDEARQGGTGGDSGGGRGGAAAFAGSRQFAHLID